ncbi:MAG: hypothetical protein NTY65_08710 [Planctomycetota bacterium]|jgi:internalin A|nr:hypothetical protein [Planctomycetota bacterium]
MMRLIALLLSLAVCLAGCSQDPAVQEENAVNAIIKLGGRVNRSEELPGRPIIGVYLSGTKITDAGLKDLKALKGIQELVLNDTCITNAGLKEFRSLQYLDLSGTKITDAGLKDLKELKGLRGLDLTNTRITDAGLKDLKELAGLQWLNLGATQITDAGMKDLKQALPTTNITGL